MQEEATLTRTGEARLRKIALVVAGLEPADAERLFAQLPHDSIQRVRAAIDQLEVIDPAEQEAAIADFLGGWNGVDWRSPPLSDSATNVSTCDDARVDQATADSRSLHDSNGVELDDSLARQFANRTSARTSPGRPTTGECLPGNLPLETEAFDVWARLRSVSGRTLGRCLARENPQTIAVVLAQLPPQQAAESIAELSGESQTEVLRRLAQVHTPDPELLDEIGAAIVARLTLLSHESSAQPAGRAALAAILSAAAPSDRDRWSRQAGMPAPTCSPSSAFSAVANSKPTALPIVPGPSEPMRQAEISTTRRATTLSSDSLSPTAIPTRQREAAESATRETGCTSTSQPLAGGLLLSRLSPDREPKSESVSRSAEAASSIVAHPTATSHADVAAIRWERGVDIEDCSGIDLNASSIDTDERCSSLESLADLLTWTDHDLAKLVAAADPWVLALALAGAAPEVARGWFARLPELAARETRGRLHRLGPWRLDDAAEAERRLVATACQLLRVSRMARAVAAAGRGKH